MHFQPNEHHKNRQQWTEERLRPYRGKEVAWNLEGSQIVASGEDFDQVFQAVLDAGLDPEQVVFSFVEPPETMLMTIPVVHVEESE